VPREKKKNEKGEEEIELTDHNVLFGENDNAVGKIIKGKRRLGT